MKNPRVKKQHIKFSAFVTDLMAIENGEQEKDRELVIYQSVVSMIHTLIEDGRLYETHVVMMQAFPEYYNDDNGKNDYDNYHDSKSRFMETMKALSETDKKRQSNGIT